MVLGYSNHWKLIHSSFGAKHTTPPGEPCLAPPCQPNPNCLPPPITHLSVSSTSQGGHFHRGHSRGFVRAGNLPLFFFVVSECPAQCTTYNTQELFPRWPNSARSSDLPVGSETGISGPCPLDLLSTRHAPLEARLQPALHPPGWPPCIPEALTWLGHTENHGKVLILEEKRLPWAHCPRHSLCHTAPCCQPSPD